MKIIFSFLFLTSSFLNFSQLAPFMDFNNFFKTFYKNSFRQLEFQAVKSFEASDNLLVYVDFRGDLKLYDGENVQLITNQLVNYKLSDYQLAWNIGPVLYHYNPTIKKKELITTFSNNYFVSDSLLVYEDSRLNAMNVRYNGTSTQLYQMTGIISLPEKIGDNTIVFKDNGDYIKFYWNNQFFDFAVYSRPIVFECGLNVICFNDPLNQSFTVFDHGNLVDVESMFAKKYKAIRNAVVYEDIQGNLWHYKNGEKTALSNFNVSFWDAIDDLVIWNENNMFYVFENGQKTQLMNYSPKDYKLKNSTLVFRNIMGGISIYQNGQLKEITKQLDCKYTIYGNTVLIEQFNKSFLVFHNGQVFEN